LFPKSFDKLDERKKSNTFRSLQINAAQVDFYSNDYLGISNQLSKIELNHAGSTGSRLISGNSIEAENCERFLAEFFETESALVFNSGYDANLGLLSSIGERHDTIIYDELVHASIRDGIRLSLSKSYSFKHNSLENLIQKLDHAIGDVFVVVESLYSMDGDFAPIKEIIALKEKYNFYLIVDEAHACGILGKDGKGLSFEFNSQIFAKIITFGKAYGAHGAAVLGTKELITYLINFARSFIYTTALPTSQYKVIKEAIMLSLIEQNKLLLFDNIQYFTSKSKGQLLYENPLSPIQIIQFPDKDKLIKLGQLLAEANFAVKLIVSPTVPINSERIRICIHAFNTKKEIDTFSEILKSF
jgi:8-amino-7-oxononanoate synthase